MTKSVINKAPAKPAVRQPGELYLERPTGAYIMYTTSRMGTSGGWVVLKTGTDAVSGQDIDFIGRVRGTHGGLQLLDQNDQIILTQE